MTLEKEYSLDGIDSQILKIMDGDGRVSVRELAETIGMSAPSIAERLRRLESRGIIQKFTVELDLTKLGYSLEAIVRIKPRPGKLAQVEELIEKQLRIISCDRVTGDDCYVAKLVLRSITELDELLGPFHVCAETSTSIIKSSMIKRRLVF